MSSFFALNIFVQKNTQITITCLEVHMNRYIKWNPSAGEVYGFASFSSDLTRVMIH